MEEIEMKFPGQSGPFHSFPTHFPDLKRRDWRITGCFSILALFILLLFTQTLVLIHNSSQQNNNNNNNSSSSKYTTNESPSNQIKRLNQTDIANVNREHGIQNVSLIHDIHKQIQRLHDKIDLLSKQNQNGTAAPFSFGSVSTSSPTSTTIAPPIQSSRENNQNNTEDSTPSTNSLQNSILQPISSYELVDVIGKAKAHILMQIQGLDDFVEFHYNQNGTMNPPCQNLPLAFHSYSTSANVETFGTCIRIWSMDNCVGDSMAFYPKILPLRENLDSTGNGSIGNGSIGIGIRLRSIGRCMTNELDESFFKIVQKTPGKKEKRFRKSLVVVAKDSSIPTVPDSITIDPFMALDSTSHFKSVSFPITDAIVNWPNRISLLRAVIQHKDLKTKGLEKFDAWTISNPHDRYACQKKIELLENSKNNGDVLGFFVSRKFSPQDNILSNNVFYQSSWNLRHLVVVENKIISWLQQNQKSNVEIRIQIYYKAKYEMRPEGFVYWVKYNYKGENPKDILSDTVQIYYLSNL